MFAARARNEDFLVETAGVRVRWPSFADGASLGRQLAELGADDRAVLSGLLGLDPSRLCGDRAVFAARRGNLLGQGLVLVIEARDDGELLGVVQLSERSGRALASVFGRGLKAWRREMVAALRVALLPVAAPVPAPRRRAPARVLMPA